MAEPEKPPPPPSPAADSAIRPALGVLQDAGEPLPDKDHLDIFTLTPTGALKILSRSLATLIRLTGREPKTQPEMVALGQENARDGGRDQSRKSRQWRGDDDEHLARTREAESRILSTQQESMVRKFYSKKPPPIALEDYLMRLQRYCPMSAGVYLATSFYIYRLCWLDQSISVTPRNAHRLVLAGLRVAMKALEDLSYPHSRFAKVGGVTETELARLEVSFCFLSDFNLRVTRESLLAHAQVALDGLSAVDVPHHGRPRGLSILKEKKNITPACSRPLSLHEPVTAAAG